MVLRRLIPVFAVLLAIAPRLAAQAPPKPFLFLAESKEVVSIADLKGINGVYKTIEVRPNTSRDLNLYVYNSAGDAHNFIVQLLDGKGKAIATAEVKKAAVKAYTLVKFAKPAAPAPAPGAVPPAPAAPMPPPMGPPTPTGSEIPLAINPDNKVHTFEFFVRVQDDSEINSIVANTGKPKDAVIQDKVKNESVAVSILSPGDYITADNIQYKNSKKETLLKVTVAANQRFIPGEPCLIELVFPPQPNMNVAAMGAGVYRRTITAAGKTETLTATDLPLLPGATENETFYLTIDGVPRAFKYQAKLHAEKTDLGALIPQSPVEIRMMEDGKKRMPARIVSRPLEKFMMRVEVDRSSAPFELALMQDGTPVTTVRKESARNERVWIDPASEPGGLRISSQVTDWVIPIDTRDLRGKFALTATVLDDLTEKKPFATIPLALDDTPPPIDQISVENFPAKQMRGKVMKLSVFAKDPESDISKVVVFFGKPAPDGKLPEGVIAATPPAAAGMAWLVDLPIPADKKGGPEVITVAATNGVDQTSVKSIVIQLIDPPTGGKIKGKVLLGEFGKGVEGAVVVLKDADGKEKDAVKTNTKGEYEFIDVLPGSYKVFAAKADSAFGTKGETAVRVRAVEEPSKADIILTRKP